MPQTRNSFFFILGKSIKKILWENGDLQLHDFAGQLTWMQVNFVFCFAFNYIARQTQQLFCSTELSFEFLQATSYAFQLLLICRTLAVSQLQPSSLSHYTGYVKIEACVSCPGVAIHLEKTTVKRGPDDNFNMKKQEQVIFSLNP